MDLGDLTVPSSHVGSAIVTTLILLRHGRSSANAAGVLAGRTPGVELDETGRAQAERVVERLAGVPLAEIVSSPALRCEQTVAPLLADRGLAAVTEPGLAEVDYGSWTGRELKKLPRSRCGGSCRRTRRRRCSPTARGWPGCRPVRSPRSAGTAHGSPPSTGRARCGWRAATAT